MKLLKYFKSLISAKQAKSYNGNEKGYTEWCVVVVCKKIIILL